MSNTNTLSLHSAWNNVEKLKEACHLYALETSFEFRTKYCDARRYSIVCKGKSINNDEPCPWRLNANVRRHTASYVVTHMDEKEVHTCSGLFNGIHPQAPARFLAQQFVEKLRDQPSYRPSDMRKDIGRELHINVPYKRIWDAKEHANAIINGTDQESFQLLPRYCQQIDEKNPNSTALVERTEDHKFRRLFISYGASGKGFMFCRPLLGLDGTHLKTKYFGILLTATAVDANGQLFPVAFGVVDAENDRNWLWFLELLHHVISQCAPAQLAAPEKLIFLSDRQKGLIDGVNTVFPDSPHGYCMRHLADNMRKAGFKHKELLTLLWKAARAQTVQEFDTAMAEMKNVNAACYKWLTETADKKHWAEAHFPSTS